MATLFSTLAYSDDLFLLPSRLLHTLSRGHESLDTLVPMAVRAIVIATLFALVRRGFKHLCNRVNRRLFPTAYISSADPAYSWIMAWIAQDPYVLSQIHDFQLSTTDSRSLKKRAKNALVAAGTKGAGVGQHNATWAIKDVIGQILPTYQYSLRVIHQGNYLWITRRVAGFAGASSHEHFRVKTIAWRSNVLRDFLIAAHAAYFAKEERELIIFHAKRINPSWQTPVSRPARPWSSVILPNSLKDDLLKDIERFLSEKESNWYASRGIPHRRGYLFHGTPGSGKTTLVTAIASKLALDIYVINPAQRGMDDAKLSKLFRDCPARSIILIEDIDCIFPRGRGHHILSPIEQQDGCTASAEGAADTADDFAKEEPQQQPSGGKHDLAPSTVTMSGVLNAIDGVSSQEGCVLIATTNHPNRLDPALSRAGRFDIWIEFTYAVPSQARDLYLHFYPLAEFGPAAQTVGHEKKTLNVNGGAAVILNQANLEELADAFVQAVLPSLSAIDGSTGSETKTNSTHDVDVPNDDSQAKAKLPNGICQNDAPSPEQANEADLSFPQTLRPSDDDRPRLSMAALQGYLLQYKEDPFGACENARKWVAEDLRSGKDNYVSSDPDSFKCGLNGIKLEVEDEDGSSLTKINRTKVKTNLRHGASKIKKKKAEKTSASTNDKDAEPIGEVVESVSPASIVAQAEDPERHTTEGLQKEL
ncbi:hypothetical protein I316_01823 [Kwoniella heveanensis BCC8398]|uniref:AAA+ ATPase domain-containing protein n=1 Tax=Kwoniella heveanensis BCC8398 TaxID=1296120 RepID=A0A1B9GZX6_9TREE|nr:hypothetical protein I316_01823 [Kwoniella heveanensis BCC8398]